MAVKTGTTSLGMRNLAIFGGVAALFLVVDRLTKIWASGYTVGTDITSSFLGIFHFRLLHNTGGAWSLFDDSTTALGVLSLAICAVLLVMFALRFKKCGKIETVGYAMVVAGGIGNVIDRFLLGYVVDFICADFISFPIFNVADIGVTCGFVLLFIGLMFFDEEAEAARDARRLGRMAAAEAAVEAELAAEEASKGKSDKSGKKGSGKKGSSKKGSGASSKNPSSSKAKSQQHSTKKGGR